MLRGDFLQAGRLVGPPPRRRAGCEPPYCSDGRRDSTRPQYDLPFLACSPVIHHLSRNSLAFRQNTMGKADLSVIDFLLQRVVGDQTIDVGWFCLAIPAIGLNQLVSGISIMFNVCQPNLCAVIYLEVKYSKAI